MKNYDDFLTALCIWREARSESREAMGGVRTVIANRVRDPRWPDSAVDVILQRLQFSSFNGNDPNAVKWPKADDAAWLRACAVVEVPPPDTTHGANHYHSLTDVATFPPWAVAAKQTARIGAFRFYKL